MKKTTKQQQKKKKKKKKTRSADFCADQIDIITTFAIVTNVVIKKVHRIYSTRKA